MLAVWFVWWLAVLFGLGRRRRLCGSVRQLHKRGRGEAAGERFRGRGATNVPGEGQRRVGSWGQELRVGRVKRTENEEMEDSRMRTEEEEEECSAVEWSD